MDEPANTSPPEPGTRVVLELTEAPETVYGGALRDEASVAYGSLLAELPGNIVLNVAFMGLFVPPLVATQRQLRDGA